MEISLDLMSQMKLIWWYLISRVHHGLNQEEKNPSKRLSVTHSCLFFPLWESGIMNIAAFLQHSDAVKLGFDQKSMSRMSDVEKRISHQDEP